MNRSPDPRSAALSLLEPPPRGQGRLWMEVQGDSMHPTMRCRDRVEVEGVEPRQLRFGDIVVLDTHQIGCVMHRYFWRRRGAGAALRTKGDSRTYFDPVWPGTRLIGRVRTIERAGRRRACGRVWLLAGTLRSIAVWCFGKLAHPGARQETDER